MQEGHLALQPGEIASYVQDFERRKAQIDFDTLSTEGQDVNIRLHGDDETLTPGIPITADDLRQAYHIASSAGEALLDQYFDRLLKLKCNLAVLFCGGFVENPGIKRMLERKMGGVLASASKKRPRVKVAYDFLEQHEQAW